MKRLTIRLTVLSVAVVLGLIAIAQARYGRLAIPERSSDPAPQAADLDQTPAPPVGVSATQDDATVIAPTSRAALPVRDSMADAQPYDPPRTARGAARRASPAVRKETTLDRRAGAIPDRASTRLHPATAPHPTAAAPTAGPDPKPHPIGMPALQPLPAKRLSDTIQPARMADQRPDATSVAAAGADRPLPGAQPAVATAATTPAAGPADNQKHTPDRYANPAGKTSAGPLARPGGFSVPTATRLRPAATRTTHPLRPESTHRGVRQAPGTTPAQPGSRYASSADRTDHPAPGTDAVPRGGPAGTPSASEGTGLPGAADLEGVQNPTLTIQKIAPAEIQVGKECTFEIKVRNTGHVAAHAVVVRDEVPQKARLIDTTPKAHRAADGHLTWDLGPLGPGQESVMSMRVMPIAEGEVGSVATVQFTAQASARARATKPELALRLSAPRSVMIGHDVPIKIDISNPGSGVATGLIVLEDVPSGMSHPAGEKLELELGALAPGESRQLNLVLTATRAGVVTNQLTARADANLSVQESVQVEVIAPQLKVAIDGPKRRFLERQATYSLSVDNPGTAAAKDIQLAAYLPKGMKFVRANNHGHYDSATHSVVWGLEELPPKEHGTVKLITMPIEPGDQILRAEGKAAQGLADEAKQDVAVEGVAAIMFEVVDLSDPIEVGGETTYEIHVVNQGSKAATQVGIVAQLPPDLKPVSASGPTKYSIRGDRVVFTPLRRLAPKADTMFRVKVKGLAAGDQRFRVQLVTAEFSSPVTKEESTRVYADE